MLEEGLFFSFSVRARFHLQTVTSDGHFAGLRFRLRLPRSEAQSRRKDTLVLSVPPLSDRGGDGRFGTLPPWRESVKEEFLIILSHCCFPQKLSTTWLEAKYVIDVDIIVQLNALGTIFGSGWWT